MADSVDSSNAIAIIGASGRYPGARTLREFWENLRTGVESVRRFTDEELLAAGESPALLADPDYVRAWPVLDDLETFDAAFFGMSPRDAAVMDPQHRFFLEVAWEAMEDAGYDPEATGGPVGVFAACGQNSYMMHHLVTNPEVMETVGEWLVRHTGNDMNFLATRVSYQMNLKGPSLNVQTACSSSLVAVHLACQSLGNGECDMALAGASTMLFPQNRGYLWKQGEIMSKDGHCRPFDAHSDGTIFGSGTGCVVLKRLSDAIRDGDPIRGVILGSAINNDGSMKVGYLAPSVEGQASAIEEAIGISGVEADSISYVEAHGTATAIGDPIEVAALTQAFRTYTDRTQFCAIGSVKANIGHLGEAAGMASLAKVLLSMEHREIPPSINFERPGPEIDFAASPVFVSTKLAPWASGGPRRAGITSLGAGGTNAHAIIEEPPTREPSGPSRRVQLLVWSAKTEAALNAATVRLKEYLAANPAVPLADVAYTLQVGRKQHNHRRILVCENAADAVQALDAMDAKRVFTQLAGRGAPSVVFMFPGGGAQYAGAGEELYRTEPAYRSAFDECLAAFEPEVTRSLRRLLLASPPGDDAAGAELERPALSVSAVFAIEYAMAKLLISWGIEPTAMIGHSMGEYVAACLSEVMTLKEAADLLMLRGRIFERVPPGAMLSVQLPEGELRPLLDASLSVAAVNAPNLCVASGPIAAVEALEKSLQDRDVECTRVHIAVAAHSAMLDSSLAEFERQCRTIRLKAPKIPFMSNLTGTCIKPHEATDPLYWVRHLRSAVRFSDGIAEVLKGGPRTLLEVGPGRTLSSLARQQPGGAVTALPTLRHPREVVSDVAFLLNTVGRLWMQGNRPDFQKFYAAERRRRVSLPTYPFERNRFWIERGEAQANKASKPKQASQLRKKQDVADWFYVPSWKRSIPRHRAEGERRYVLFADEGRFGDRLSALLGPDTVRVRPGYEFVRLSESEYIIRPGNPVDHVALLEGLRASKRFPTQIVHAWSVVGRGLKWSFGLGLPSSSLSRFDKMRETCFDSLLLLARALDEGEEPVTLTVVSDDLFSFGQEAVRHPARALLSGPTRVIPREMPQIRTRHVDIGLGGGRRGEGRALEDLVREIESPAVDPVVLYRGGERWVRAYEPARVEPKPADLPTLRRGGTYVITGGLGGIGLEVAEHFARTAQAKLVLVGRSPVPPASEWDAWIARHGDGDRTSQRIRKLRNIIALGGEVLPLSADVADREQMSGAMSIARDRFGPIHGAVHAAGVIDDGLIALKTPETAAAVIAAKAKGALVLQSLIEKDEPDFLLLFSSVSSILGLEGQIDYTAANAFLDALADEHEGEKTRVVSINWNAWADVGMAVAIADKAPQQSPPASVRSGPHPLLGKVVYETKDETRITTSFSRAQHWLLSEHVVRGADALIPGTGYLEIVRAAFELHGENRAVELRDVFFLAPFGVRVGESRALTVQLNRAGSSAAEVSIFSERHDAPHVTARVAYVDAPPPKRENLDAVLARCSLKTKETGGFLDQQFMDFGPRWGNMRRVSLGNGEALVALELPEPYVDDLANFRLHPALMDMATGGAQAIVPGFDQEKDFYVPFTYGRVLVRGPLPAKVFSHVRFTPTGAKDLIGFDVTLYDEAGVEIVAISRFMMKRVDLGAVLRSDGPRAEASSRVTRIGAVVHQGIQTAEGMDVLDRILASPVGSRIVACSVDLGEWAQVVDAEAAARAPSADHGPESQAGTAFARPTLGNAYVAPRDDVERELAALFRELLGVDKVGINDDFFELGGQSLIAVRLFNKIRKKYGVDLPISTLFEAPNIAGCAAIIRADAGIEFVEDAPGETDAPANGALNGTHPLSPPPPSGVAIVNGAANGHDDEAAPESVRSGGRKSRFQSLVLMQKKGTELPFYCVAGMGGTLNNLRAVAMLMGEKRPVYGLQPPGADDEQKRLYHVEDLAEHYIAQIRTVQPHGPYLLGGYSGGGIAAFEMTRQLEAQGEKVLFLGFLDTFSPHLPLRPLVDRMKIHLRRVKNYGPAYLVDTGYRRLYSEARNLQMKGRRQLGRVFAEKYRYEALQESWVVAESRYTPGIWGGNAVLFRAREESAISRWTAVEVDEQHGWGRYVKGGVEVVICPGNHETMCEEPYVRTLAQKLREAIEHATASTEAAIEPPPVSGGRSAPPSQQPASGR